MTQPENQLSDEELFAQMLSDEPEAKEEHSEEKEVESPEDDDQGQQEAPDTPEDDERDEGAPEAKGDSDPGDTGDEAKPEGDSSQEPEWYSSLSDEARAHFEELQGKTQRLHQSYQAVHGRVAPMQRQVADLRKQLEKIESPVTPTLDDLEKSDEWKAISEDLPQEAGQVKSLFISQARAFQKKDEETRQQQEQFAQYQQRIKAREEQRLESVFPNHRAVTTNPIFSKWCGVVQQNPTQFPDIAEALQSPFYEDAQFVLDRFRSDLQQHMPDQAKAMFGAFEQPQAASEPAEKPSVSRRKPPNPSPPSQSAGVSGNSGGRPMTEEEYFASLIPD